MNLCGQISPFLALPRKLHSQKQLGMLLLVHESGCHASARENAKQRGAGVTRKVKSVRFTAIEMIITVGINQS